jgi:hypothetical protein
MKKDQPAPNKPLTDKQRIEFAKQIEAFAEASNAPWKRVLTFSFLKGIVTGLGVFLGGTIGVALLLWILTLVNQVPFVGELSESAQQSIEDGTNKN